MSDEPEDKAPEHATTWRQRLRVIATSTGAYLYLAVAAVIVIAVVVALLPTTWGPIALFALLFVVSAVAFISEKRPWERSRVVIALFTAYATDWLLFRLAIVNAPHYYRSIAPGIVTVSVFCGFLAWQRLRKYATSDFDSDDNPLTFGAAFCISTFLMINVASPILDHYMPGYWITFLNGAFSESNN